MRRVSELIELDGHRQRGSLCKSMLPLDGQGGYKIIIQQAGLLRTKPGLKDDCRVERKNSSGEKGKRAEKVEVERPKRNSASELSHGQLANRRAPDVARCHRRAACYRLT